MASSNTAGDLPTEKDRARDVASRFKRNDLIYADSYKVQYNGSYRSALPPAFFKGTDAEVGDIGTVFMDFENEAVVICYGGDDGGE